MIPVIPPWWDCPSHCGIPIFTRCQQSTWFCVPKRRRKYISECNSSLNSNVSTVPWTLSYCLVLTILPTYFSLPRLFPHHQQLTTVLGGWGDTSAMRFPFWLSVRLTSMPGLNSFRLPHKRGLSTSTFQVNYQWYAEPLLRDFRVFPWVQFLDVSQKIHHKTDTFSIQKKLKLY